jgi:hypothetical protein
MYTQNEWLLSTLLEFYQNREHLDILKKIINREFVIRASKKLSIRIVNWFVTNYAKQHFTAYEIQSSLPTQPQPQPQPAICIVQDVPCTEPVKNTTESNIVTVQPRRFFVWTSYKSTEDSYSKQMFDPYCRQQRILIPYDDQTQIETTIGQLHFFKWAIMNKVLDYIIANYDLIEKDMNIRLNTLKRKPSHSSHDHSTESNAKMTRKKREELSTNACRIMRKEVCTKPVQMRF